MVAVDVAGAAAGAEIVVEAVYEDADVKRDLFRALEDIVSDTTVLASNTSAIPLTKLAALVSYPVLSALKRRMDYRRYNGAALLGLRGLVFKSHGSADEMAFEQALERAYDAARNNLLERVRARIAHAAPLLRTGEVAPLDVSITT